MGKEASLVGRDQVSGLFVPKFHIIAQHVDVKQLPDVLLSVIVCKKITKHSPSLFQRATDYV